MQTIEMIRAERKRIHAEQEVMLAKVEAERRRFDAGEEVKYAELEKRFAKLDDDLVEAERCHALRVDIDHDETPAGTLRDAEGRPVRVWDAKGPVEKSTGSLGRVVRAALLKDFSGLDREERALAEGSLTAGGAMVPGKLMDPVLGSARAQMVAMRAGGKMVDLPNGNLTLAKVVTAPTVGWYAENALISDSDATLGKIDMKAKKVAGYCKLSIELAQDAPNAVQLIESELTNAAAEAFDKAFYSGAGGAAEPLGMDNDTDVTEVAKAGAVVNLDELIQYHWAIFNARGSESQSLIYNGDYAEYLSKAKDGEGQYFFSRNGNLPDCFENIKRFATQSSQIATVTNQTTVYLGDFSQVYFGVAGGATLEVTRTTGDAFKYGQVWVRIVFRGDVAIARPEHIYRFSGVAV